MAKEPIPKKYSESILISDIKNLIEKAKESVVSYANSELVLMNWRIGRLIKSHILQEERSEYGKEIVATLSRQLFLEFGRGFTDLQISLE